jgi:hypothetical protein
MSHMRLKAILATGALAASIATPTIDQAMAVNTVPALPDVTAALSAAGLTPSQLSSVTGELSTLQGLAPGGSLGVGALSGLDNALTTINGGLVSNIVTLVLSLVTALNPASPGNLTSLLGGLTSIGSAGGASTAVQQAVAELTSALSTAGLGQLLSEVTNQAGATSALSDLTALQGLQLGANSPAGSLNSVGSVLTSLAGC